MSEWLHYRYHKLQLSFMQESTEFELSLWGRTVTDESRVDASFLWAPLAKNVECRSSDTYLGSLSSVELCARAVAANGGKFFIYGHTNKAQRCYQENTATEDCPEGYEQDHYHFYRLMYKVMPHTTWCCTLFD